MLFGECCVVVNRYITKADISTAQASADKFSSFADVLEAGLLF